MWNMTHQSWWRRGGPLVGWLFTFQLIPTPPQKKTRNTRIYLKVVARVLWGSCNGFSLELLYLVVWFVVWFVYFSILFDRYAMVCYMSAFAPPKILRPKDWGWWGQLPELFNDYFHCYCTCHPPPPKYSFLNPEKIWKNRGWWLCVGLFTLQ